MDNYEMDALVCGVVIVIGAFLVGVLAGAGLGMLVALAVGVGC